MGQEIESETKKYQRVSCPGLLLLVLVGESPCSLRIDGLHGAHQRSNVHNAQPPSISSRCIVVGLSKRRNINGRKGLRLRYYIMNVQY